VTVEGSVTVRAGLLDADGRRVTVQDATGAILARLPIGAREPAVGQRLRLTGEVGTYYGAPQLAVDDPPETRERANVKPLSVRSAPLAAGLEWRLVTVAGKVQSVQRSGESWRAELVIAGGGVPIHGLARSGIPSTALTVGREATITGLAKRAHPTATDQRMGVVPRSTADISLGGQVSGDAGSGGAGGSDAVGGDAGAGGLTGAGDQLTADVIDVALADLAAHEGQLVRVGGEVQQRDGARLIIADVSATAVVRLSGEAVPLAEIVERGDMINAIGEVERNAAGGLEVVVADSRLMVRTTSGPLSPADRPSSIPPAAQRPPNSAQAPLGDDQSGNVALLAIVAACVLLGSSGLLLARGRRLRSLARQVVEQLASLNLRGRAI
jgi:hypothetical protein